MQLKGRDATAYLTRPDPKAAGLLLAGDDPIRVATARADVLRAMVGPDAEAEMRLTRMSGAELRKDPAQLSDATRAQGFFPGARAVLVEDATDSLTEVISATLADWREGDAQIVVTAGNLTPRSALRKLFEGSKTAAAITLYDEPPGPEEIARLLNEAGLTQIAPDARQEIGELSRSLDPGDFRRLVEKIGLYMHGEAAPLAAADIAACAPASLEADVDALCLAVFDREEGRIADLLRRLAAQGTGPVSMVLALGRHVRQLHQIAVDPSAAQYMRVAGGFRRKDAMTRQARAWGPPALGRALGQIVDTDLQLRSADTAPQMALVERLLLRIARLRA